MYLLAKLPEKDAKAVKTVNVQDVFEKKAFSNGHDVNFDVSDLIPGTYYLRVINPRQVKEKQVEMTRVIVE
jgi:hypothetical protein